MESGERGPRLNGRKVRSVYQITYSKENAEIIESRESFAPVVLDSFQNADPTSNAKVVQWVCRILLESLHSNIDKHSVNERMEFPRAYVPLLRSLGSQNKKQWFLNFRFIVPRRRTRDTVRKFGKPF